MTRPSMHPPKCIFNLKNFRNEIALTSFIHDPHARKRANPSTAPPPGPSRPRRASSNASSLHSAPRLRTSGGIHSSHASPTQRATSQSHSPPRAHPILDMQSPLRLPRPCPHHRALPSHRPRNPGHHPQSPLCHAFEIVVRPRTPHRHVLAHRHRATTAPPPPRSAACAIRMPASRAFGTPRAASPNPAGRLRHRA